MVLKRLIDNKERAHLERDKNRISLPFEWGLEHLELPASVDPRRSLHEYSQRMLDESSSFFECPPCSPTDFSFDGHLLNFPSGLNTPYPENNRVWARFFPASQDLAVVVIPQFNSDWEGHVKLCRLLQMAGITCLRMSPPYHHRRKPGELARAEYMVSANLGRTLAATRQGVMDLRRAIDWLCLRGYQRIGLIGTSVGALLGFLTLAHDPRIRCSAFVHISTLYADVVWHGVTTSHVRVSLEEHVTLEELRHFWAPISPVSYVHRLKGPSSRRVMMFSGKYDPTCLPGLSQDMYREFDRWAIPYRATWLPCGHYTMGDWPFNVLVAARLIGFLRGHS